MALRLLRLGLLMMVVTGTLAACIIVPPGHRGHRARGYGPPPPPPVHAPAPPPPCRWVWVGRWECR
jgi:hypothetical protein